MKEGKKKREQDKRQEKAKLQDDPKIPPCYLDEFGEERAGRQRTPGTAFSPCCLMQLG
jgi:hypothetical protein